MAMSEFTPITIATVEAFRDQEPTTFREVVAYLKGVADALAERQDPGRMSPLSIAAPASPLSIGALASPFSVAAPLSSLPPRPSSAPAWAYERTSEVRLPASRLSAEWYELTGTDRGVD
jgi:hypothetical protein